MYHWNKKTDHSAVSAQNLVAKLASELKKFTYKLIIGGESKILV